MVVYLGEAGEAEEVEVDLTQSMSDEETGPENVEQVCKKIIEFQ